MFFITQLIGILVINQYSPEVVSIVDESGNVTNQTIYNLPYGMDPPPGITPWNMLITIVVSITIAVVFMLVLMRYKAEFFLRAWFFIVVALALGITINAFIKNVEYSSLIAFAVALPLAAIKLFKRNIIVHNVT